MSRACRQYYPENGCHHTRTVDNDSDGECVCMDCGLVLDQLYTNPFPNSSLQFNNNDLRINIFIADVCTNACIAQSVVDYASVYYKTLKTSLKTNFKDEEVAAYAIYEALNRMEVPRTAQEIEHFSGVSMKQLFKIEAALSLPKTLNENPSDYVTRYCSLLNMDYSAQTTIQAITNGLQEILGNLKCNCAVAVVIYLFCKYHDKKISLKEICSTCCISTTSVHRVIRKLKCQDFNYHPLIVKYMSKK
jgi:transcription initiation factor TFIIIB Brf1 subunit/transcription initiation factor TFIIB